MNDVIYPCRIHAWHNFLFRHEHDFQPERRLSCRIIIEFLSSPPPPLTDHSLGSSATGFRRLLTFFPRLSPDGSAETAEQTSIISHQLSLRLCAESTSTREKSLWSFRRQLLDRPSRTQCRGRIGGKICAGAGAMANSWGDIPRRKLGSSQNYARTVDSEDYGGRARFGAVLGRWLQIEI